MHILVHLMESHKSRVCVCVCVCVCARACVCERALWGQKILVCLTNVCYSLKHAWQNNFFFFIHTSTLGDPCLLCNLKLAVNLCWIAFLKRVMGLCAQRSRA